MKQYIFISLIFIVDLHCSSILTIDEQIAVIKEAPESERFKLMNQFKRQLVRMNQEEREEAISQLKRNQTSIEERVSTQSANLINSLESSSIEQHIEMSRVNEVKDKIEEIKEQLIPNVEHPSLPDNKVPSIPNVEHPSIPDNKVPSIPNVEHPSIPDNKVPSIPNVEHPSIPDNKVPSIPNVEHPSIPDNKVPSIPNVEHLPSLNSVELHEIAPQGGNLR